MTRTEQLEYLIHYLAPTMAMPKSDTEKWRLFHSLVNVRKAAPIDKMFLKVQDEFLKNEIVAKGITDIADLSPIRDNLYLWHGNITTLKVDAIVNAANSGMLGCFRPCHGCIDNCIHTYAGVQLRLECAAMMQKQGHCESAGRAKITKAYNLPSNYILHTIGPIISGRMTKKDCDLLASCYRSCLELAEKNSLQSIAFCCISTGEFHFPNDKAAEIAVKTVNDYLSSGVDIKVVFNVFKDVDRSIYTKLI